MQAGNTALWRAAFAGQTMVARILIAAGADKEAKSGSSNATTPLMAAAYCGHAQMVQLLCDCQVDRAAATTLGRTAAYFAIEYKHWDV
eukprot:3048472-Prymnesium_polylepis.1